MLKGFNGSRVKGIGPAAYLKHSNTTKMNPYPYKGIKEDQLKELLKTARKRYWSLFVLDLVSTVGAIALAHYLELELDTIGGILYVLAYFAVNTPIVFKRWDWSSKIDAIKHELILYDVVKDLVPSVLDAVNKEIEKEKEERENK